MSTNEEKTTVSFSFSFGQQNYLYEIDEVRSVLASRLEALFTLKSLKVTDFKYAQLGGTAGDGGILHLLAELYYNHALLFHVVSKLRLLVQVTKMTIKLSGDLQQNISNIRWKKYQKAHEYDHYLDVDLHVNVMSGSNDSTTIKRSVVQATNQMMLLFPEIAKEVQIIYPDYVVRMNLIVLSRQGSNYIIQLCNILPNNNFREQILRLIDRQHDASYPVSIHSTQSNFGLSNKIAVSSNVEILKYFHALMRTV